MGRYDGFSREAALDDMVARIESGEKGVSLSELPIDPADKVWIVAVTSFGGSMGEAFFGQTMLGPFDEQWAKSIAAEYNKRADAVYGSDEHCAEAFELTSPGVGASLATIVDGLLADEDD